MTPEDERRMQDAARRAGEALSALAHGPAGAAADAISAAFDRAGASIEGALSRAARSGELSFSAMADAILRDLQRLAIDRFVTRPVDDLLSALFAGLPFFGARADGGPVNPGGAYLVGERGPELFRPHAAGEVSSMPGAVTVHVHLPPGAEAGAIRRSEGQISAALARAVRKGMGRL